MPVPVPVYSKPPAHSVHKNHKQAARTDYVRQSVFRHLTNSLPQPPAGLPPSFASREEWISSLPSWRRNKPRRIWEEDARADHRRRGFQEGLTAADNASVIKGAPAQAGIPPISTLFTSADMGASVHRRPATDYEDADDEMSPLDEVMGWQSEDVAHLTDDDDDMGVEQSSESGSFEYAGRYQREVRRTVDLGGEPIVYTRSYERGTFSPVYEERSPGHDSGSSPMAPNTPFGDFVDHAVASQAVGNQPHVTELQYPYTEDYCGAQCYRCQHYVAVEQPVHQAAPVPEPVVTPTATPTYRKLAEPLSEWVSDFVWKVCTTGMSLPPQFVQPTTFVRQYPNQPPVNLAHSVHSMLLSTLLQPSAVFLALWYIVRLPVFFGSVSLGPAHSREVHFRAELLGEAHSPLDRDAIESYAPFRLVLLGCMLANKWLDDHTFSNKTWHTISNVPTRSLNKLESLALDLFAHDLSIPMDEWSRWLKQINMYHQSLSSPAFPQPISRPSSSPHTIVRKAIEELIESSDANEASFVEGVPQPVFWGLEGRKMPASEIEDDIDVLEIDLDEDGPLREEYLPKRRVSNASNTRRSYERPAEVERVLPPPARWSPAADEPILRVNNHRNQHQYVAPQPIARGHVSAAPAPPAQFHQALDMSHRIWNTGDQVVRQSYAPPHAPVFAPAPPLYAGYEYTYPPPPPPTHSRSQSLSFNAPAAAQAQGHFRSYSQSQFEGGNEMGFAMRYPPVSSSAAPQWPAHHPRSFYPSVYEPLYDYHSRPLVKV